MHSFHERLGEYARMTQDAFPLYLPDAGTEYGEVAHAMEYSLTAGGKRFRAALLLEVCRALGGEVRTAVPFACAVEMVHAYSLIHDDLPCMDNSPVRRGKPSCHIRYGEAMALLAGDGLLTLAFEVMLRHSDKTALSCAQVLEAAAALSAAAGASGMIGGQVLDMLGETQPLEKDTHELMNLKKTGELIRCSAKIGGILAGADTKIMQEIDAYAKKIGLAFQIIDDILDNSGSSALLGKPVGNDVKNGKQTYVTLYGEAGARARAEDLVGQAKRCLSRVGIEDGFLYELAELILSRNS